MEKINPQPEPPIYFDLGAWIRFIFDWIIWFLQNLIPSPTRG